MDGVPTHGVSRSGPSTGVEWSIYRGDYRWWLYNVHMECLGVDYPRGGEGGGVSSWGTIHADGGRTHGVPMRIDENRFPTWS